MSGPARAVALAVVLMVASAGAQEPATRPDSSVARSRATRTPSDPWLGADKAKHAALSAFAYGVSFAGARLAGLDRRGSLAAAAGPVAILSVVKETRDRGRGGRFSVRDLAADAVGAVTYAAILARTAR